MMPTQIRKRDGKVAKFEQEKITTAIWKAVKAVGGSDRQKTEEVSNLVVIEIEKRFGDRIPDVESVQDIVEKVLIETGHAKTAKAYILYRKSHQDLRDVRVLFDTIEVVENYLDLLDWRVKENANMTYSLQGLNNHISSRIIAGYWLKRIYPEEIRKAHEETDFHIHDLGTLGPYCFDEETKILTENGWKFFKDVKKDEKVATKNLETGELEFQIPYGKQIYNYLGEMFSFEGRNTSLLVTPEHRLLVRRKHKKNWEFINPPEFKYGMEFDKKLSWKGEKRKFIEIPNIKGGNRKRTVGRININDYAKFMGWYISEGSLYEPHKGDYRISIAQLNKVYREELCKLLTKMDLPHNTQSKLNIHLHSKELYYHLKKLGISKEKYIPKHIKELPPDIIRNFLFALFKGDGSFSKNGKLIKYTTSSKQLAEDVVECLLKINLCGTIGKEKQKEIYKVSVEHKHLTPIYRKRILKKHYKGKVYDFSVKNGTLVVMRNGKVVVSGNCVGWDLKDLLMTGFTGVFGKVQSKPAKHFRAILGQVVNFFYTLQGEAAGAQAFSNFDTLLAPFIKYDNLGYKEVKQAMQEFIYNMAVPTRVGFQCPFTNITLDLKIPDYMKNDRVIIGGEFKEEKYGGFEKEIAMFNRAFAEVMVEGDAKGRIFTFPIPTYNITKDFDWDNEEYDLIWEMTSKYGIPYFSNYINADMKPEDSRSMCCRLRLSTKDLKKRGGGLFGANPLTGSIGVVTMNLPKIAYESQNEEHFFKRLGGLMDLAKESLIIKRKALEKLTEQGLYPYSKFYLRMIKKNFGEYWKNHFSTIGLLGMNEAIMNLFKGESLLTLKGNEFAGRVLDFMREKLGQYQQETGEIFNLEATPAEGTTYRFAKHNKRKYRDIIVANENSMNEGAEPYFTNSSQLPVDAEIDLFKALQFQDSLQTKYTGGTVFHTFVGEKLEKHMVKKLAKKISENFKLPYFTITPIFSICPVHGYIFGEHPVCPKCKAENKETGCEVYSRIVGYIRPINQWNSGKRAEFKDRIKFKPELNVEEKPCMKIKLFKKEGCDKCEMLYEKMKINNVEFEEEELADSMPEIIEMAKKQGLEEIGLPVIICDGKVHMNTNYEKVIELINS